MYEELDRRYIMMFPWDHPLIGIYSVVAPHLTKELRLALSNDTKESDYFLFLREFHKGVEKDYMWDFLKADWL